MHGRRTAGTAVRARDQEFGTDVMPAWQRDLLTERHDVVFLARPESREVVWHTIGDNAAAGQLLAGERIARAVEVSVVRIRRVYSIIVEESGDRHRDRVGDRRLFRSRCGNRQFDGRQPGDRGRPQSHAQHPSTRMVRHDSSRSQGHRSELYRTAYRIWPAASILPTTTPVKTAAISRTAPAQRSSPRSDG